MMKMDKRILALGALAVLSLAVVVYLGGTAPEKDGSTDKPPISLREDQVVACNAAEKADSCDTKLPKLVGLVTKEDCCNNLGKCC